MNTQKTNVAINNVALKEERAKRIRRHVHYSYDDDNRTVTVEMRDGYDNLLGKEVFTEEDMKTLAQEKGEKIIDKKNKDKKRSARNKVVDDTLEDICKVIGMTVISIAAGKVLDVAGKKSAKLVKNLARKIAK